MYSLWGLSVDRKPPHICTWVTAGLGTYHNLPSYMMGHSWRTSNFLEDWEPATTTTCLAEHFIMSSVT